MKKHQHLCALLIGIAVATNLNAQTGQWKLAGNTLTGTEILGSKNAFDVNLISNNVKRFTIKPDGRIGLGTTAPTAFLHVFGTTQIENNSATIYDEPLLTLRTNNTGTPTNPVIAFRGQDTLYAIMGYDFSTRDVVFSTQNAGLSPDLIINHDNGFVGLNTKTPQARLHVLGNQILDGDLTMASTLGKGDINFTTDQQNIAFANPGASASAMIYMFTSPTSNKRMVLSHSAGFSNWGLQYDDAIDQFNFLGGGNNRMAINLTNGFVGIANAAPAYRLDVSGNSRIVGNLGVQTAPNTRTIQVGSTQGALIGIGTAEYIQDAGNNLLSFNENLIPVSDGSWTLGTSTNRWSSVWAVDGTINTSDARDKTNIRDLGYGLKEIMQLRAVKFNWKNNADAGDKLGVVAQEIQKVLPEVVRDWEYKVDEETGKKTKVPTEKLGVMYADIIPVLIRGMQEQQKEIEDLKQLVSRLTGAQVSNASANNVVLSSNSLEQNTPNPVKTSAVIRYNIAVNGNAQLKITDANGKLIKQIQLANAGSGSVNIDCSSLTAGTYYYSLIADGKMIDTKKMVVTK